MTQDKEYRLFIQYCQTGKHPQLVTRNITFNKYNKTKRTNRYKKKLYIKKLKKKL